MKVEKIGKVNLELTEYEAGVLLGILHRIGGWGKEREVVAELYRVLEECGGLKMEARLEHSVNVISAEDL